MDGKRGIFVVAHVLECLFSWFGCMVGAIDGVLLSRKSSLVVCGNNDEP